VARPQIKIVDLMVAALKDARLACDGGRTRFCQRKRSRCPRATAQPTCCTLQSEDPSCSECKECVSDSLAMIVQLIASTAPKRVRAKQSRTKKRKRSK
jgi:hypothetical protein